jgi:hypothetical protein
LNEIVRIVFCAEELANKLKAKVKVDLPADISATHLITNLMRVIVNFGTRPTSLISRHHVDQYNPIRESWSSKRRLWPLIRGNKFIIEEFQTEI